MARSLLVEAGFAGTQLDVMLGIEWIECLDPDTGLHYHDAVGDVALVNEKWGPSIGAAQIRSLRDPNAWGITDRWRVAEKLRDPLYNAQAAFAISENGAKFSLWSAFKSGAYSSHVGEDFELHSGHVRAHLWNI